MARKPVLDDHARRRKRLIPPILTAMEGGFNTYRWSTDAIPEVFWIALFQRGSPEPRKMEALVELCNAVSEELKLDPKPAVHKMSPFLLLDDDGRAKVLERLSYSQLRLLRVGLTPLNEVFSDHPLKFLLHQEDQDELPLGTEKISTILDALYDRKSKVSAVTMATVAYLMGVQGKLVVSRDCPSSGFLGPRAAQPKREFGSSGWFDYAVCWR